MGPRRLPLKVLVARAFPDADRRAVEGYIACGRVLADGERVTDPLRELPVDVTLELLAGRPYVSRGGEKLAAALDVWRLPVSDRVFIDAGASTGGFTDCLLGHGASRVYAVDVGYNQLDYRLRRDSRVESMERTNVMALTAGVFRVAPHAVVADLSFRSICGAASDLLALVSDGWMVALVKPQFEWRDPAPAFDGVIRDRAVLERVALATLERLSASSRVVRVMLSPIPGRKGNQELLVLLERPGGRAGEQVDPPAVQLRRALDELFPG